jgi:hypothetical protein
MKPFFCAFIKNKYLKLSIIKPKPFKNRQTSKKQARNKHPFTQTPQKPTHTEKPFKTQNHKKQQPRKNQPKTHKKPQKPNTKMHTTTQSEKYAAHIWRLLGA